MLAHRLSLLLVAAACAGCAEPPAELPPPELNRFSVATYNVNFEREASPQTLAVLGELDADLLLLQETTEAWEQALEPLLGASHPHRFFRQEQPDGGLSVHSRVPIRTLDWLPSAAGSFPSWCGEVDSTLGTLRVLGVHLHPPVDEHGLISGYLSTSDERLAELEAARPCIEAGERHVVLGDFNEEKGPATDLLLDAGFTDAAGRGRSAPRTWSWDTPLGPMTGRPDHIFVGPDLRVLSSRTDPGGGSDHRAVRAVLTLR